MDTSWLDPSLALQFVETLLWVAAGLVAGAFLVEVVCVLALLAGGASEEAPRKSSPPAG